MSRATRRDALLGLAAAKGFGAVLLRSAADIAWYTAGFDVRVDRSASAGSTVVLVSPEGEWVVTDAIEGPRLRAEEPALAGMEVVEHPWTGPPGEDEVLASLAAGAPVAQELDVAPLRRVLDEDAVAQYRVLGADTRAVFDEVAAGLTPSNTELEAAAALAAAAWRRGAHTPVLLVAGAGRIPRFRHPLPTRAPLGARAMLVACVERGGLFASLTRYVHFEEPPAELARRLGLTDELLRRVRDEAARPGRTTGEVLDDLRRFYAEVGFPDEWRLHHQGGIAGYRSREEVATMGAGTEIHPGMAFAWNPSITGAKSEETYVLLDGGGAEVLT